MEQNKLSGASSWLLFNFHEKLRILTNHRQSLMKELSLVVLMLFLPLGIIAQDGQGQCEPDIAGLESSLPEEVNIELNGEPGTPDEEFFFRMDVTDQTDFLTGNYGAWCVDRFASLNEVPVENVKVFSSYDDVSNFPKTSNPENFDKVNWILNEDLLGQGYTYGHIQYAIWTLLGEEDDCNVDPCNDKWLTIPRDLWDASDVAKAGEIVAMAENSGDGYIPGCGDLLGIVLIPETKQSVIIAIEIPSIECYDCDGKVTELKLQFNGDQAADIRVETKKKGETSDTKVVFEGNVDAGGMFSFVGNDKKGTLGTEITVYVNGVVNTKIHTSCSQPIGPGLVSGDFEVISGSSRNGGELCPVDTPPDGGDCGDCDGKVTELKLQFNGDQAADIRVETKKEGENGDKIVFEGNVDSDGMFSFVGNDNKGTLGTEITIYVNGVINTKIHTSCSQPIGPGLISGDFEVISGSSRNGGELCPVDTPPDDGDCECDGKVTELELQYNGDTGANIVVETKKEGENGDKIVFDDYVDAGGIFSFVGNDKKGTLGTEITIYVNGEVNTNIHTSCSQPIGPGLVSGDFEVISGSSRNGGELCPLDNGSSFRTAASVAVEKDPLTTEISEFSVNAWPNPSDNQFYIKVRSPNVKDKVNIEVFDMRSRTIHKDQFNGALDYSFGQNLNAGLYFVRIQQGDSVETIKLMKR